MTRPVTYFILAEKTQMVKIGKSTEAGMPDRLASLQTGSPETLDVLLVLEHRPPFEERQMHRRFAVYRAHGEWFEYRGKLFDFINEKRKNPAPTKDDDFAATPTDTESFRDSVSGRARDVVWDRPAGGPRARFARYDPVTDSEVPYDPYDMDITRAWESEKIN